MENIGKYQVRSVLGHGGMGTVYEALDPLINRKVAVKVMIQGLAESPDLRARFLREAQAAGGLRHRNIVTVYDLGEDRGQPYIAMEFIEGTDLEKIIQNREPYSVEWKLDVLRQVCNGLGYAHKAGIVHRDVKPANIRVTPEGEVKIMDFGIAHLQSSTMTKSGLVLGTVHYMAPEQVQGLKLDNRADIFSVGAIAYELIAFKRPFEGESLTGVMFKIMHERPDPAGIPKTDYSPGLESIILRALARDPNERYPSLDDMHEDLERLVRDAAPRIMGRPPGAKPPSGEPETVAITASDVAKAEKAASAADAETEALRRRVEKEIKDIRAEMDAARADGHLQKAIGLCQRLLELDPDDAGVTKASEEIQASIQDKEVEQLAGLALAYATDGDTELALKIAAKIERIAPRSARFLQLKSYLEEEATRKAAEALAATAGDHLALGDLQEALASAEEALKLRPSHHATRELRDRVAGVLAKREKLGTEAPAPAAPAPAPRPPEPAVVPAASARPAPAAAATATPIPVAAPSPAAAAATSPASAPPAAPAGPVPEALTPLPEGAPANPDAAALLDTARRTLRERAPQRALAYLEQAAALEPAHAGIQRLLALTRIDARKAEIESLTTAALNHFVQNDYPKARKAVDKALALDPENKKAKELLKILNSLR